MDPGTLGWALVGAGAVGAAYRVAMRTLGYFEARAQEQAPKAEHKAALASLTTKVGLLEDKIKADSSFKALTPTGAAGGWVRPK